MKISLDMFMKNRCTRCACPVCYTRDEEAAYQDSEAYSGRKTMNTENDELNSSNGDLSRRLYNSHTLASILAIYAGLLTLVFYAKYGW